MRLATAHAQNAEAVALAALRYLDLPVAELEGPAREVKLLSDHRRDLARLGLLEVESRPGAARLSDLIWLKELYNPHWAVPNEPIEVVDDLSPEAVSSWKDFDDSGVGEAVPLGRFSVTGPEETLEGFRGLGRKDSGESYKEIDRLSIR